MFCSRINVKVVRLGAHIKSNSSGTLDVGVVRFYPHERYSKNLKYNDIALVQLAKEVPLSPKIRPACLPRLGSMPSTLIATGWGRLEYFGETSDTLQKVELPQVNQQECLRKIQISIPNYKLRSGQICYGGVEGKDTCQGKYS